MVTWIEQLREWQRALPQRSADEFVEAVKGDIFQEQIFVFTPKGEVKDLPRGSTPLDMAYRIHTDIGDHCAGARIITNTDDTGRLVTRLVPLDYELKGGEIVDIVVNRTVHPTRDWLSFARTAAARNKIRRYLKTYEREINLQLGRERLDLGLKSSGNIGLNAEVEQLLLQLCRQKSGQPTPLNKFTNPEEIYIALGREELPIEQLMEQLLPLLHQTELRPGNKSGDSSIPDIEAEGHYLWKEAETSTQVQLGKCCYPLPGDPIIGIVHTRSGYDRSSCQLSDTTTPTGHTARHRRFKLATDLARVLSNTNHHCCPRPFRPTPRCCCCSCRRGHQYDLCDLYYQYISPQSHYYRYAGNLR